MLNPYIDDNEDCFVKKQIFNNTHTKSKFYREFLLCLHIYLFSHFFLSNFSYLIRFFPLLLNNATK